MLRKGTGFVCLLLLAAAPLAAEIIHGCVDQKGTLRIVAAAEECDGKEYAISFESGDPDQPIVVGTIKIGPGPVSDIFGFAGGNVQLIGDFSGGGGGGAGKTEFAPITVIREVDSETPDIYLDVVSGKHIPSVVITFAQGARTITLQDVLLTSWSLAPEGAGGGPQLEQIGIEYGKITIEFDGETACFDRKQYKQC